MAVVSWLRIGCELAVSWLWGSCEVAVGCEMAVSLLLGSFVVAVDWL